MIYASLLTDKVSVKIDTPHFAEDLERFQNAVDRIDRMWDAQKQLWFVKNPEKYRHLPFIAGAFKAQTMQKPLFPETK